TNLGRASSLSKAPSDGVSGLQRRVLPLVETRADFELSRAELRDADRGAADADLEALDKAAHQIAVAENVAVFHGWKGAITGSGGREPTRRRLPLRVGPGPVDRLRLARRRRGAPVSGGELQLPRGDAGGGGGAEAVGARSRGRIEPSGLPYVVQTGDAPDRSA